MADGGGVIVGGTVGVAVAAGMLVDVGPLGLNAPAGVAGAGEGANVAVRVGAGVRVDVLTGVDAGGCVRVNDALAQSLVSRP